MRNSTGWSTGSRRREETSGLRRHGFNLIGLGALVLVAAPAVGAAVSVDLLFGALVIGIVICLAGWRMLVIARRRAHSSD